MAKMKSQYTHVAERRGSPQSCNEDFLGANSHTIRQQDLFISHLCVCETTKVVAYEKEPCLC